MNSVLVKRIPSEDRKNPLYDRQRKGRVDKRNDSVCTRFGLFCHNDVVGRFTSSAIFGSLVRRNWLLLRMEKSESPSLIRDGEVIRCKSENHVPSAAISKEPRLPDVFSQASGDRLEIPGASASGREKFFNPMFQARRTQARLRETTSRTRFQSGSTFQRRPVWCTSPTHTMSWLE